LVFAGHENEFDFLLSSVLQLAKLGGVHVTATCGDGARQMELVKSLGADEVLDSKTAEGESLESPSGKKYDTVIQCGEYTPFAHFKPQLSPSGKVIDLAPSPKSMLSSATSLASFSKQKCVPFLPSTNSTDYYFLFSLMQQKKLKTVIDSQFPLSQAEKAWAASMTGHVTGKVIVTCTEHS
jgi:NADPH:quinone reductase-like Zn-dependent oxidoreductase